MASQTGQQTIAIHILPNINQTIKFGQSIEYNRRNIFLQNSCKKKETERLVPDIFLIFKKALFEVKASNLLLSFDIFL